MAMPGIVKGDHNCQVGTDTASPPPPPHYQKVFLFFEKWGGAIKKQIIIVTCIYSETIENNTATKCGLFQLKN